MLRCIQLTVLASTSSTVKPVSLVYISNEREWQSISLYLTGCIRVLAINRPMNELVTALWAAGRGHDIVTSAAYRLPLQSHLVMLLFLEIRFPYFLAIPFPYFNRAKRIPVFSTKIRTEYGKTVLVGISAIPLQDNSNWNVHWASGTWFHCPMC